MNHLSHVSVPGQFDGSSIMVLAVRGGIGNVMPIPATGDLTKCANTAEYRRRVAAALTSAYTRDILDGAIAAGLPGLDGDELVPLFGDIIDTCHAPEEWTVIEPVAHVTLESTLLVIEIDLLRAVARIGSAKGMPVARRALSDPETALHPFAIDALRSIGPEASDAVPDLRQYVQRQLSEDLPTDEKNYCHRLKRSAARAIQEIEAA